MNDEISLKIFCTGNEQDNAVKKWQLEKDKYIIYPGFLVVHVDKQVANEISADYIVEDITSQFVVTFDGTDVIAANKSLSKLDEKPHHFLVQFKGPIKNQWIAALKKHGVEFREPYKTFTYIVRCKKSQLEDIWGYPHVRWVGYLPTYHRDKVKMESLTLDDAGDTTETLIIEFFDPGDMARGRREIRKIGIDLGSKKSPAAWVVATRKSDGVLSVRTTGSGKTVLKVAQRISQIHGVRVVRPRVRKNSKNDVASGIMEVDSVRDYLREEYEGYELTGKVKGC